MVGTGIDATERRHVSRAPRLRPTAGKSAKADQSATGSSCSADHEYKKNAADRPDAPCARHRQRPLADRVQQRSGAAIRSGGRISAGCEASLAEPNGIGTQTRNATSAANRPAQQRFASGHCRGVLTSAGSEIYLDGYGRVRAGKESGFSSSHWLCAPVPMAPSRRTVYVTVNASSPPARRSPAICAKLISITVILSAQHVSALRHRLRLQLLRPDCDRQSGFRFRRPGATRLYIVPSKKTIYSIDVRPELSFFKNGGKRDEFGYRARADAQYLLNHLYLDVYAENADQLRADVAEIAHLLSERATNYGVTGELKYSSRTSATFNAAALKTLYPLDKIQPNLIPVALLDRKGHNYRIAFNHKTFPLTSLFLTGEFSDYSFTNASYKDGRRSFVGAGFLHDSGRTVTRPGGRRRQA